ncbi:MAG TPA: hypothetical protein VME24_05500 [Alphaproteobacteria bacterium]|nr:hypothetical protein [Alphaproteobacteria bacterium]
MNFTETEVLTTAELLAAARDPGISRIIVSAKLSEVPTLRLSSGQTLTGSFSKASVRFADGEDGVQLSENNTVENLELITAPDKRVLFNDTAVEDFGTFVLRNLKLAGATILLAAGRVRAGHVDVQGIDVVSADARWYSVRPAGYGVEVIPGAFTLWNQQPDPSVTITANLTGLNAGRPRAPVHGSGIFVSGAGDSGGKMIVHRLETGAVFSHGGIALGTPDRISGGVFVVYGTFVDVVRTFGRITTYGPNDMALDNWGVVDRWVSDAQVTSHGPSGIGFVNFGKINLLQLKAPIETFGLGARGFNVYAGTVKEAEFDRIITHGDGAVGIQIGQPIGKITVLRGIETFGGTGDSLVKGVVTKLSATALSIKAEGLVRELQVSGGLVTHTKGVAPLELLGSVESLYIAGQTVALGDKT